MKSAYTIALISVIGGILVHLMVLFVIEIDLPDGTQAEQRDFSVQFLGDLTGKAMPAVIEQAALKDSSPLFMPTRWNSVSQMSNVASLQSATEIFEPFGPQLAIDDARPTAPVEGRSRIEDEIPRLPEGPAFVLSRYGRQPASPTTASSPGVSFAISSISGSASPQQFKDTVTSDLASGAPGTLWNPVRLFLQIREGIPIGLPLVSRSSGFADWDTSLQSYFASLGFYRRLNDGYYEIWVYP